MDSPDYIHTPFARPSPNPLDASAQALALSPSAGPPAWPGSDNSIRSSSTLSSVASPSEWSWSQASSSTGHSSPSSVGSSPLLGGDDCVRSPALLAYRDALQPATAAAARARRSFASRTADKFQQLHPQSHAFVLSFARTPCMAVQTTGSQMYASLDGWDTNHEDPAKEEPTIFDSVSWRSGPGADEERFDVYLCQSGRFSLGAVATDENVWGFSSPHWEKVGPFVFFDHM